MPRAVNHYTKQTSWASLHAIVAPYFFTASRIGPTNFSVDSYALSRSSPRKFESMRYLVTLKQILSGKLHTLLYHESETEEAADWKQYYVLKSRTLSLHPILQIPDYTKCRSTLLIPIWIHAFFLCNPLFSLLYSVEPILPLTLVVALHSSLPGIARYRRLGDGMKISLSLFSIFPLS